MSILEFGSGQSTRWWAERAGSIIAVEYDEQFVGFLRGTLQGVDNVSIVVGEDYKRITGTFDIVSIDGYPRIDAAHFVLDKVAPDGLVLVDNSDVESLQPICALFHEQGFYRIDFIGPSPAAYHEQCTSLFFKSPSFFQRNMRVNTVSPRSLTEQLA